MGRVFGLSVVLFSDLWTSQAWQERTEIPNAPWDEPYHTANGRTLFSDELGAAVSKFV